MSTTTATFGHAAAPAETAPRKSFFQWLIEARMRQGEAKVRTAFARMSDHHLADIGFTPDQIRYIRANGSIPDTFWAS
ncbi:MAG: DUF1127 domain-containing protein [Hyphomicrobiaceae bacterium]|nr:DUF1127 domain-containing protein [Hyphomicrobiaceae bacterium]